MTGARRGWLVLSAWWHLARFDLAYTLTGNTGLERRPSAVKGRSVPHAVLEQELLGAMVLACCLYWKPVPCLQRSACTVRLFRAHNLPASLVIGFRAMPFVSHAWVEVNGRVVNDSPAFPQRLQILHVA